MELTAVIGGLNALPEGSIVTVVSDAQYVVLGYTQWMQRLWIPNGWPSHVKNQDLWKELIEAADRHKSVAFIHVRGHKKNDDPAKAHHVEHNEKADKLAGEQTLLAKEQVA
jgi:ribonuclease HI